MLDGFLRYSVLIFLSRHRQKMFQQFYMCRVLPKLRPLWLAPLLDPYWREMTVSPALNCSSENCLAFFSASLGPIDGWPYLEACVTNGKRYAFMLLYIRKEEALSCVTKHSVSAKKKTLKTWWVMFPSNTLRPRAWRQMTTALRFCLSHRSTVWKSS